MSSRPLAWRASLLLLGGALSCTSSAPSPAGGAAPADAAKAVTEAIEVKREGGFTYYSLAPRAEDDEHGARVAGGVLRQVGPIVLARPRAFRLREAYAAGRGAGGAERVRLDAVVSTARARLERLDPAMNKQSEAWLRAEAASLPGREKMSP